MHEHPTTKTGTNHVDCLSDQAFTTGLVFESQTLSSQLGRPLVLSSIKKGFFMDFLTKESRQSIADLHFNHRKQRGLDLDTVRHMQQDEKRQKRDVTMKRLGWF